MQNSFNVKKGLNIEPTNNQPTTTGDITCDQVTGNIKTHNGSVVADVVTQSNQLTLTNKTLDAPVLSNFATLTETATPTTPNAGRRLLYAKADGLYQLDSSGLESNLSVSSGGGRKNYLSAYTFDQVVPSAIVSYINTAQATPVLGSGSASTALTIARTTTNSLSGTASLSVSKNATNAQGHGVSLGDIAIDRQDRTRVLEFSFDLELVSGTYSSTGTYSDLIMYIAQFNGSSWVITEPAPIKIEPGISGVPTTARCTFQVGATTTLVRPLLHVATTSTSTYSINFENFFLGRQITSVGNVVTDWTTYTPNVTTSDGVTSIAGNTVVAAWRRVGADIEVRGRVIWTATPTFATLRLHLPTGLTFDPTLAPASSETPIGHAAVFNNNISYAAGISPSASNTVFLRIHSIITAAANQPISRFFGYSSTAPSALTTSDIIHFEFKAPIAGWSSGAQMSAEVDNRVVAFEVLKNSQTVATNAASVKVNFNTSTNDTHNAYRSDRYNVPVAGWYEFNFSINLLPTNIVAGSLYAIDLWRNGTFFRSITSIVAVNATLATRLTANSPPYRLNAGDFIEVYFYTSANHSVNNITIDAFSSWFAGKRLTGSNVTLASEVVALNAVTNGTTQSVTNNTITTVAFGLRNRDTHNSFNTTTNTYTVPVAGTYQITSGLAIALATGNFVSISIILNGSNIRTNIEYGSSTGALTVYPDINLNRQLNSGDTISISVNVAGSAGNSNINPATNITFLDIVRVS